MKSLVRKRAWVVFLVMLVFGAVSASASAVVVHVGHGQTLGVTPKAGSTLGRPSASTGASPFSPNASASDGTLTSQGGSVLQTSSPYLIFWDPSDQDQTPASDKALLERFFTDVAADSGSGSDLYAVGRQYYDTTGFADQAQTFNPATQVINDAHAYPASAETDRADCPTTSTDPDLNSCLSDAQIQAELDRLVAADSLPTGDGSTIGDVPLYFVVTPDNTNVCFADGSNTSCDEGGTPNDGFCQYHGDDTNGTEGVLYASIPLLSSDAGNAKSCQTDGTTAVQAPNGADDTDISVDGMSHEDNELITDPVPGTGWVSQSGNEEADNCTTQDSTVDPNNGDSPNAYQPALGGDANAGTLFDETINGHNYYTQSEWSDGDTSCELRPTAGSIAPNFAVTAHGTAKTTFDPSSSTSTRGYASATWDFGDGSGTFQQGTPAANSHNYGTPGDYSVSLTLVDTVGNKATKTATVAVGADPTAAFTESGVAGGEQFTAAASKDTNSGGSITSYAWNFGDGTTATGPTVTHQFKVGTFPVTLTVTDNYGLTGSVSHNFTLRHAPVAAFASPTNVVAVGAPVAFNAGASNDPNAGGSITGYAWNFGDGAAGTTATPSHAFAAPGSYTVTLTVTDSTQGTDSVAHTVIVAAKPSPKLVVTTKRPATGEAIGFDGSGTADASSGIASYAWAFGDGKTGTGAKPSHRYAKPGTYTVALTVTAANGLTSAITQQITVVKGEMVSSAKVRKAGQGVRVSIKVSGPGTLKIGSHRYTVKKASTVTHTLLLTAAQKRTLHKKHKLVYKVAITFTPPVGGVTHKTLKLTLRN